MNSPMEDEGISPGKGFAAELAHVRLDVAVPGDDVVLQIAPLPEFEVALLALEGFHAGVCGGEGK